MRNRNEPIGRREFIGGVAALGAAGWIGFGAPLSARGQAGGGAGSAATLPARGEFVVRNAYVLTMDAALGDIADGDVHVRDGAIVAVGRQLNAPGATVIDGRGMIALPGLVDTHWHMWNTLLRSFAGNRPEEGYFPLTARFGALMTPDDLYHGTRLAAAEALYSGITTVHDYCHNVRSRRHAEAGIRALREAGLRGRWSYGWPQGHRDSELINIAEFEGLHKDWEGLSGGLLSLGLGWRGMFRPSGPLPPEVFRREFDAARNLGLPLSVHVGSAESARGQIDALARERLLGPDVQLIHALSVTPAEIEQIAAADSPVSVSPGSELRIGYGFPKVGELLSAGVRVGASVDTLVLGGSANFFGVLSMVRGLENARHHNEFQMTARRALELGTIGGARSLGMDDRIGSLTPGKRADLILVTTRRINMGVFTDPAQLIVEAAQPQNVDTVVVDGRILKRGGRLTALSEEEVVAGAAASLEGLRRRAGGR